MIKILDKFEKTGCLACNKLKCACTDHPNATSTPDTISEGTSTESEVKTELVKSEEIPESKAEKIDITAINGTSEDITHFHQIEEWVKAYEPYPEPNELNASPHPLIRGTIGQLSSIPKANEASTKSLLNGSWPPLPTSKIDNTDVYFHGLISRNTDLLRQNLGNPVDDFFRRFSQASQVHSPGQVVSQNASTRMTSAMTYRMKLVGQEVRQSYFNSDEIPAQLRAVDGQPTKRLEVAMGYSKLISKVASFKACSP